MLNLGSRLGFLRNPSGWKRFAFDVPFYDGGWAMAAGADLGVAWSLSDRATLAVEVGARYHADLSDDDGAIGGLGLGSINDTGSRTAFPVGLRFQMRF